MATINSDTVWYHVFGIGCEMYFEPGYGPESGPRPGTEFRANSHIKTISKITKIPQENIKLRCAKTKSATNCILKTYFNMMPLTESNFLNSLVDEVTSDMNNESYKKVVVFGHSYGGAIVNRLAEIMNLNGENENLSKLYLATFGSIYLANEEKINKINIFNYMSNADVAIMCNKLPQKRFEDMHIKLMLYNEIICALPPEDKSTKTKQLCLYDEPNPKWPNGKPLCLHRISDKLHLGKEGTVSIFKWREHNHYSDLERVIMKNYRRGVNNFINVYESSKEPGSAPYLIENTNETEDNMTTDSSSIDSNSSTGKLHSAGSYKKYKKSMKYRNNIKSRRNVKSRKNKNKNLRF
jgi:hypothetical protein